MYAHFLPFAINSMQPITIVFALLEQNKQLKSKVGTTLNALSAMALLFHLYKTWRAIGNLSCINYAGEETVVVGRYISHKCLHWNDVLLAASDVTYTSLYLAMV